MIIRKSNQNDLKSIMDLIKQAQLYFKNQDIDQWQDGYPNEDVILQDISTQQSYVIEDDYILGTMFFTFDNDPNYDSIKDDWLTQNQNYGVIHRIVVNNEKKGMGLAKQLLDFAVHESQLNNIKSIRIDTHNDNQSMQRFLLKNGFQLCGHITLESGAPRIAFEKIIE